MGVGVVIPREARTSDRRAGTPRELNEDTKEPITEIVPPTTATETSGRLHAEQVPGASTRGQLAAGARQADTCTIPGATAQTTAIPDDCARGHRRTPDRPIQRVWRRRPSRQTSSARLVSFD